MEESHREWMALMDSQRGEWQEAASSIEALASLVCQQLELPGELHLFGSAVNGFGNPSSDVDLVFCITPGDKSSPVTILQRIEEHLQKLSQQNPVVYNITRVYQPKSIVLKLTNDKGIEVDLQVNNHLGLRNTELLKAYSEWDKQPRYAEQFGGRTDAVVRTLKEWARKCGLLGTVDGMINSYAFTLLVIYYLIWRGVLPNLQQLGCDKPERKVGECDTRFLEPAEFETVQQGYAVQDSAAQLICGFFHFYAIFNWRHHQVAIRLATYNQHMRKGLKPLWVIEDPFDTSNNLGHHVSVKGRDRIVQAIKDADHLCQTKNMALDWNTLCPADLDKQCSQTFLKILNLRANNNYDVFAKELWNFCSQNNASQAFCRENQYGQLEVYVQFSKWEDLRICQSYNECNCEQIVPSSELLPNKKPIAMYISLGYAVLEEISDYSVIPPTDRWTQATAEHLADVFTPLPFSRPEVHRAEAAAEEQQSQAMAPNYGGEMEQQRMGSHSRGGQPAYAAAASMALQQNMRHQQQQQQQHQHQQQQQQQMHGMAPPYYGMHPEMAAGMMPHMQGNMPPVGPCMHNPYAMGAMGGMEMMNPDANAFVPGGGMGPYPGMPPTHPMARPGQDMGYYAPPPNAYGGQEWGYYG